MCWRQSRKVIWDMTNTLFLTMQLSNLLLFLSFSTRKHTSMASRAILSNFFIKNSELKTTHNTFSDYRVHLFRQGNLSFRSVYKKAKKGSKMHFMAVKTERSEIRQITQYLIILDTGAVRERILFMEKNAMISIG